MSNTKQMISEILLSTIVEKLANPIAYAMRILIQRFRAHFRDRLNLPPSDNRPSGPDPDRFDNRVRVDQDHLVPRPSLLAPTAAYSDRSYESTQPWVPQSSPNSNAVMPRMPAALPRDRIPSSTASEAFA